MPLSSRLQYSHQAGDCAETALLFRKEPTLLRLATSLRGYCILHLSPLRVPYSRAFRHISEDTGCRLSLDLGQPVNISVRDVTRVLFRSRGSFLSRRALLELPLSAALPLSNDGLDARMVAPNSVAENVFGTLGAVFVRRPSPAGASLTARADPLARSGPSNSCPK